MLDYERDNYYSPAPIAIVTLRNPLDHHRTIQVKLLIDPGSDITLLPKWALDFIGVSAQPTTYELEAFDGTRSHAQTVVVDVMFLKVVADGVVLQTLDAVGTLGRDILAGHVIVLDGPNSRWYSGLANSAE